MTVLAQLEAYQETMKEVVAGKADKSLLRDIFSDLSEMEGSDERVSPNDEDEDEDLLVNNIVKVFSVLGDTSNPEIKGEAISTAYGLLSKAGKGLSSLSHEGLTKVLQAAASKGLDMGSEIILQNLKGFLVEPEEQMDSGASVQPGSVPSDGIQVNQMVDSEGYGLGNVNQLPSGFAAMENNNNNNTGANRNLANKIASMKEQILSLEKELSRENVMTFADFKKKRQERKAFWQGTEEPKTYELMGDQDSIREKEDRQMLQTGDLGGPDGMVPGDEQTKKLIQRAEMEKRMARRAEWLKEAQNKSASIETFEEKGTGKTRAINTDTNQVMADDGKTASKSKDDEDDDKDDKDDKKSDKDDKNSEDDKKSDDKKDKKDDDKKSDDKDDKKSKKDDEGKECDKDDDDKKKKKSKAYMQGTEEPKSYELMGDQDSIREKEDRQMLQTGDLGGQDGMVPGDEQTKKEMQRMASIGGKLLTHASGDKRKSKWVFSNKAKPLFTITANQAYGDFLNDKFTAESTFSDLFHSKDWGNNVRKMVKNLGLSKAAEKLGVKLAEEPAPMAPMPEAAPADMAAPAMPEEDLGMEEPAGEEGDDLKDRIGPMIEQLETALEDLKVEVEGPEEGVQGLDVEKSPEPDMGMPEADMGMGEDLGELPPGMASVSDKDMLEAYAFY